jgi:hypothetical protein
MEENQSNNAGQGPTGNNIKSGNSDNIGKEETGKVSNQFLGQMGEEQDRPMPDDAAEESPQLSSSSDSLTGDIAGENTANDIGSGLSTGGDFASMTGQTIDDLDLPGSEEIGQIREDPGAGGVDTGERNTIEERSGQYTTGHASSDINDTRYKNSGDLGQVDPGQQNYVEDQDRRQAFRAGDYKTSQKRDPEEGSDKYNPQETNSSNAENVGGTAEED